MSEIAAAAVGAAAVVALLAAAKDAAVAGSDSPFFWLGSRETLRPCFCLVVVGFCRRVFG